MNDVQRPLSPYRALELPGAEIALAGKMLADLGADVVKVEPPGGDAGRRQGPFFPTRAGGRESVIWRAYQRGKRGVTLDLQHPEGVNLLRGLIAKADFLIEGFAPGAMAAQGLGFPALQALNPGLIQLSITPFGQTGPYAAYQAVDLVPLALSGYLYMTGEREGAPLRVGVPQSFLHASGAAVVGGMIALWQRHRTGRGQLVDCSAQHAQLPQAALPYALWDYNGEVIRREGSGRRRGHLRVQIVFPASDGHMACLVYPGHLGGKAMEQVIARMRAAGCDVQRLTALDWRQDFLWNVEQERIDSIVQDLTRYFRTQTKAHLFDLARETGLMMAPVNTIEDLFNDEQLHARGYWQSAPGDAEDLHYPGPAVRLSGTPLVSGAVAPSLGQHNEAVYGQWAGLSPEQVRRLHSAGCV